VGVNPLLIAKLVGYAVAAAFIGWGVHLYNDHIRAPLLKEIALLTDLRKADALAAQKALEQRKIENEKALQGYVDYAREADNKYVTDLAALNRLRDHAAALKRGGPAGQTGTGNPATPDSPTLSSDVPARLVSDLIDLATRADEVAIYAQSCYEFVNAK